MGLQVGPVNQIQPSAPVPYPERRPWEKAIVLDIIRVTGASEGVGKAFFTGLVDRRPREMMFTIGKPKAANFHPGLYDFRLEVVTGYGTPMTKRIWEGRVPLHVQDMIIQLDENALTLANGGTN